MIANAKELVTHAVDRALAARAAADTQGSLFTVADFGTADAGTSMVSTRIRTDAVGCHADC